MRVLDLGGTVGYWHRVSERPAYVTVVNLEGDDPPEEWIHLLRGDACELRGDALASHDLVFSNSLIEHVGGPVRRQRLAEVIHAAAPKHWVQTPYRYFPVEPHWLFPGFQFLPLAIRARISVSWPLGHIRSTSASAVLDVLGVELLGRAEMRYLFPDSELLIERFGGVPKSLIAARC
jgi:hypothetical protein